MSEQKEKDIWLFRLIGYCSCVSPRRCVAQTNPGLGAPWPDYRRTEFLQTFRGSPRQPGQQHRSLSTFWFRIHGDRLLCPSDTRAHRHTVEILKNPEKPQINAAATAQQQGCSCMQRVVGVHVGTRSHCAAPSPPFFSSRTQCVTRRYQCDLLTGKYWPGILSLMR